MKNIFFLLLGTLWFISACSDPTSIGAGLLENEEIFLDFTDTVGISAKSIPGDSIPLYRSSSYCLGELEDPYFGKTSNLIYASTSFGSAIPEFSNTTLDSVVFKIPYATLIKYGDTLASHTIEVFQLTENYRETLLEVGIDSIFSNTFVEYDEANKIGERTLVPRHTDSLNVFNVLVDSIEREPAHLRIKIDNEFGQQFIDDPAKIESDTIFQDFSKGFVLRSTPQVSSYMGLDFSNAFGRKMVFYYTKDDEKRIYEFDLGNISHGYIEHDYSGSVVESKFNDPLGAQEYLFQESYSGSTMEFDLSGLAEFSDKAINFASLEITLADIADYSIDNYPSTPNIALSYISSTGNLVAISDLTSVLGSVGGVLNVNPSFGGNLKEDDDGNMIYAMNITNHVINLLEGELGDNNFKLIATNYSRSTTPNRSIIYGNGSNGPAPRLKLVITEP